MSRWTRRDVLKTGLAAAVLPAVLPGLPGLSAAAQATPQTASPQRERTLLDFDWRFHLGHASDPS